MTKLAHQQECLRKIAEDLSLHGSFNVLGAVFMHNQILHEACAAIEALCGSVSDDPPKTHVHQADLSALEERVLGHISVLAEHELLHAEYSKQDEPREFIHNYSFKEWNQLSKANLRHMVLK